LAYYNTIHWDDKKYKCGHDILVYSKQQSSIQNSIVGARDLWHGKVTHVVAHIVQDQVIQVFVKVRWYDLVKLAVYPDHNQYYITDTYDIISPASIRGHCTVIPIVKKEAGESSTKKRKITDLYYICNLFSKYYS
jgi:hypothetical protein